MKAVTNTPETTNPQRSRTAAVSDQWLHLTAQLQQKYAKPSTVHLPTHNSPHVLSDVAVPLWETSNPLLHLQEIMLRYETMMMQEVFTVLKKEHSAVTTFKEWPLGRHRLSTGLCRLPAIKSFCVFLLICHLAAAVLGKQPSTCLLLALLFIVDGHLQVTGWTICQSVSFEASW